MSDECRHACQAGHIVELTSKSVLVSILRTVWIHIHDMYVPLVNVVARNLHARSDHAMTFEHPGISYVLYQHQALNLALVFPTAQSHGSKYFQSGFCCILLPLILG